MRSDDWPGRSNATKITPSSKSLNSTSEKTHKQNHSYEVVTCTYRVSISNVCDIPFQCILDSMERLETPCKEADCLVECKGGNKRTRWTKINYRAHTRGKKKKKRLEVWCGHPSISILSKKKRCFTPQLQALHCLRMFKQELQATVRKFKGFVCNAFRWEWLWKDGKKSSYNMSWDK